MPEAIAHYKILDQLGSGALGEVYRARDTRLGRTVAVKVLPAALTDDRRAMRLLAAGAEKALAFSHPNVAAIFEIGNAGAERFLVFEYVPGDPLDALISGRPLNVRRAVELAIQLADALAEAEGAQVMHGDIRPHTIMVTPKDRAKLMNFGVAPFTAGGAARLAASSAYVAPEQLSGGNGDSRSDIYSLGAVLFEMLTGRPRGAGLTPSGVNSRVPVDMDAIVGKMLALDPEERSQSAATVAAELRAMAAVLEARATAEEAEDPKGRRDRGRRTSGTMVVTGVLVVFAAIAAWLWWSMAGR